MKSDEKQSHKGALKMAENWTSTDFNQIWFKASPNDGELKFAWKIGIKKMCDIPIRRPFWKSIFEIYLFGQFFV